MIMRGRPAKGWLRVAADGVAHQATARAVGAPGRGVRAQPSAEGLSARLRSRTAAARSAPRSRRSRSMCSRRSTAPARSGARPCRARVPRRTAWGTVRAATSATGATASASEIHATAAGTSPLAISHDDRGDRRQHDRRDQPVHRPRRRRDARVVGGDRGQHCLWQLARVGAEHLHVEHQVEPQHRQQKPAAGRHEGDHRR